MNKIKLPRNFSPKTRQIKNDIIIKYKNVILGLKEYVIFGLIYITHYYFRLKYD